MTQATAISDRPHTDKFDKTVCMRVSAETAAATSPHQNRFGPLTKLKPSSLFRRSPAVFWR